MRLPVVEGKAHLIDEEKAQGMIDKAVWSGINYFDTAYVYHSAVPFQAGMSEVFLGRALKAHRAQVLLATKLPSWYVTSRSDMDRYLDEQLQRLQTDHIDFYLVHSLTGVAWERLRLLGITEFLNAALADRRIRHAGFSFHDEAPQFNKIVDSYDWSFCQIQYNFMDENYQAGRAGLEYAASKGLGVVIMEPLRGGNITSRIPEEVETVWRSSAVKRKPAEWALRFVWDRPEVNVALSGMTEPWQLEENLRIAEAGVPKSLTRSELATIEKVREIYEARTRVQCTSCGYCLPCPSGVNIPANFLQLNNLSMFQSREAAEFFYLHILKTEERASHCEECGQCEDVCPQHIPIRDMLKEVVRELEPQPA